MFNCLLTVSSVSYCHNFRLTLVLWYFSLPFKVLLPHTSQSLWHGYEELCLLGYPF